MSQTLGQSRVEPLPFGAIIANNVRHIINETL
jgi:hypothetical protein